MIEHNLRRREALVRGAAVLIAGATAGCLGGFESSGQQTVTMTEDLEFDPETIRIETGATVVWENTTSIDHNVTAREATLPEDAAYFASGGFGSENDARSNSNDGLIEPDETYEHTFQQSGTYEYVCLPHEKSGMEGTVVVTESDGNGMY